MDKDFPPGTKVQVKHGPLGVTHYKKPFKFVNGHDLQVGYETDVADVPHAEPGWFFLNTDNDELIAPVSADYVKRL